MLRPNNCKKCGGKMQYGGIVDYLDKHGVDSSKTNRKKLFGQYFDNYTGTAEQNIELLNRLQKGEIKLAGSKATSFGKRAGSQVRNSHTSRPNITPADAQKMQYNWSRGLGDNPFTMENLVQSKLTSKEKPLESGVVVDKRNGKLYEIDKGKIVKTTNVLTGKNVNSNAPNMKAMSEMADVDKTTPVGYYTMRGDYNGLLASDVKKYHGNIRDLDPLSVPGVLFPAARSLAVHELANPANRKPLLGSANPYVSYGCINLEDCEAKGLFNRFPKGDTLRVIDTKTRAGKEYLQKYPNKQTGGKMQLGGSMPRQEEFGDDIEAWQVAMDEWMTRNRQQQNPVVNINHLRPLTESDVLRPTPDPSQEPMNRIQKGIQRGMLDAPEGYSPQDYYNTVNEKPSITSQPINWQNVGIGMRRGRNILAEIAGRVDRGRQNQYDYEQQTALGQMNGMPLSSFQPSPYQLYAEKGGKLTDYQLGGMYPRKMKNVTINNWTMPMQQLSNPMDALTNLMYGPSEEGASFNAIVEGMRSSQGMKSGGLTPAKAKEMLEDGKANGKKLTAKQKRYFGMIYGRSKK